MQQQKSFLQKVTKILVIAIPLAVVAWFGGGALGMSVPAQLGGVGLIFVAMIYAILLALAPSRIEEKPFFRNLKVKLPVTLVLAGIIWWVSGKIGFPVWWQIEFVAFAFVGMVFFIILDMRTMYPEKTTRDWIVRLLGTYAVASILFIVITDQLPQFDPQVEIDKLNKPPVKLSGLAGPEVIKAGRRVFEDNKCFNCHKVFWEGNSDRGPNLGSKQIGLYSKEYIKKQIIEPRAKQSPGFTTPKQKRAMPTYYEDDLSDDELDALVAYLKTLRDPEHVPVEGKLGDQWTWYDDKEIVKEGQKVFEGKEPATEGLNCSVCHGTDGVPMMTGALDFRKANAPDSKNLPDEERVDKPLKEWSDALWYKRVTRGIPGTPMAAWGTMYPHLYLWKAIVYERTFHDPLEEREKKVPIPHIPTKEDIKRWEEEGLFLDPLL